MEPENCVEHCCSWEYLYLNLARCVLVVSLYLFARCCLALAKQNNIVVWNLGLAHIGLFNNLDA